MSRNSFQTVLTAWIRPYGTGAIIGGECGMHPLVFAFLISWFGMLMLFGAAVIASAVSGPRDADQGILPFLLVLAGMGTFGLLLVICGRYTARSESRFLIDFLAGTVDGKPPLPAG